MKKKTKRKPERRKIIARGKGYTVVETFLGDRVLTRNPGFVSAKMLEDLGACPEGLAVYRRLFGDRPRKITFAGIERMARRESNPLWWFAASMDKATGERWGRARILASQEFFNKASPFPEIGNSTAALAQRRRWCKRHDYAVDLYAACAAFRVKIPKGKIPRELRGLA